MNKIIITLQYIFLTAILIFGGFYLYSSFYPFKVVEINSPAIMEHTEYKVGEEMAFVVTYCKYMSIPGQVYPELVDGVVYNLKSMVSNAGIGCGKKILSVGRTPDVVSGKYHIHMRTIYKVNDLRDVEVFFETNEFIIKGDE